MVKVFCVATLYTCWFLKILLFNFCLFASIKQGCDILYKKTAWGTKKNFKYGKSQSGNYNAQKRYNNFSENFINIKTSLRF